MTAKLYALLKRRSSRYLVVGGSVYIFELLMIITAQRFKASPVVAVGLSFWLGTLLSFLLQKFVAFGDMRTHHKILIPQLIAVCLLVLFNFGFTVVVTKLLSPPVPTVMARTIALAITVIWNFYLYKTKIFKTAGSNPVY